MSTTLVSEATIPAEHGHPSVAGSAREPASASTAAGAHTDGARSRTAPPAAVRRAARTLRSSLWKSAAVILFFALWELVPTFFVSPETRVFLPPLHEVLAAGWQLILDGQLQANITASLSRAAAGFVVAVATAVPLGLLVAWYKRLDSFLTPLLELFRNTATLALLPVFTLLLGIGETSKITIVAYAAFFPILLNTIAGVRGVDPLLVRAARTIGVGRVRLFARVVLPAAVPTVFTGIRMGGAASILVLVAAEMVGAKAGLGFLIVNAQNSFLIPDMYAGILTISILGLIVNAVLVALERRFSRWRSATV